MTQILENAHLQLRFKPGANLFTFEARQKNVPALRDFHFFVGYRRGRRRYFLDERRPVSIAPIDGVSDVFGAHHGLEFRFERDARGVAVRLIFAVAHDQPLLLWRAAVENGGRAPVRMEKIELLRVGFMTADQVTLVRGRNLYARGDFEFALPDAEPAFFSNGWGSWNYTGAFAQTDIFRRTRLGPFAAPMRVNPGTPQPGAPGHFASDMFAVLGDRAHRGGLLLGFLSQKQHFGSLEALLLPGSQALSLWANGDGTRLDPGQAMQTDWACLQPVHLDAPDPLGAYLGAVAREHDLDPDSAPRIGAGWCSWYRYFQDIDAAAVDRNLDAARRMAGDLPLDFFQVDDGWQAAVGDWDRFDPGFPGGPAPLAARIQAHGLTPGLWLAPFILHPAASIHRRRPDWLLRNRLGLPVTAGFVWDSWTRVLDASIPEVVDHAAEMVHRAAAEWGFSYLKLDFLYAAARPGRRRDPTRTRAAVLRSALERIRAAAGPETVLVGCGCPIGSGIGLFEAMRIGPDVAPHWRPRQYGTERFIHREPDMPSARNSVHNVLTRAPFHRRWWVNDPDCLVLREEADLTLDEVRTLATAVAMTGGPVVLSDDLAALSGERLAIARALLPPIGRRPHVLDWFDSATPTRVQLDLQGPAGAWHLLAVFNWRDEPADYPLDPADFYLDPDGRYAAREFWTGQIRLLEPRTPIAWRLAAHGCAALAVRDVRRRGPHYLGSSLHFSQGLEAGWRPSPGEIEIPLHANGAAAGVVDLFLPAQPAAGDPQELGPGIYRFPVRFQDSTSLVIRLRS